MNNEEPGCPVVNVIAVAVEVRIRLAVMTDGVITGEAVTEPITCYSPFEDVPELVRRAVEQMAARL